ncbi:hypothetical protein [endosymbiont GvMRE of Glomus versiforme]|uniref:hypothetical protein n=1 Tax=endosymbiont GvMRE of Glomus versiforme TaxID=2039283 RepID=UPI000EBE77E9|nr:hypothetical protein [endosymbiont GvMRE of Glomus versiforme]RHZ36240.1 hypothetical protein GvMRE_Ic1g211 [endosymbiont GvMRE of Glomus versiforme]
MIELQKLKQELSLRKEEFQGIKEKVKRICRNCIEMNKEHEFRLARIYEAGVSYRGNIVIPHEVSFEEVLKDVRETNEIKYRIVNWEKAQQVLRDAPLDNIPNFLLVKQIDNNREDIYEILEGDHPIIVEEVD